MWKQSSNAVCENNSEFEDKQLFSIGENNKVYQSGSQKPYKFCSLFSNFKTLF